MKRTVLMLAIAMYSAACVRPSPPAAISVPAIEMPSDSTVQSGALAVPAVVPVTVAAVVPQLIVQQGEPVTAPGAVAAPATTDSIHVSPAPSWDIDVRSYESTDRVEHYVRMFTGPGKERIKMRLERGTRYEAMIRKKMRDGGLPEDMYYLALIESGFDPNAYSRAAAVGMWQFMTSTARDMGMRVDWWIDERRDPMKSTGAAVRFIKGLKAQFGSLYLAAAAYNGGPGRVARGLSRYADDLEGTTGDDLFFALAGEDYLRNETRDYVPQLIAAALIAKEPERYGMELDPLPPIRYDSVRVGPATPLAAIAHAAGASMSQLKDLNPQVLRGVTPPRESFWIRLPVGDADTFSANYAALPKSERVGLVNAESRKGETIASIARKAGISGRQLSLYNPNLKHFKSGRLVAGQRVLIPSEAVAAAAVPVPGQSLVVGKTSKPRASSMRFASSKKPKRSSHGKRLVVAKRKTARARKHAAH